MSKKKSSRRILLTVTKEGHFVPMDDISREMCRRRKFRIGEIVSGDLRRPRNSGAWRTAHQLGILLADNLEDFAGLDCHAVLKRLQLETGLGCDLMAIRDERFGMVHVRVPRSLSFDEMDEGEWQEIYSGFCQHIIGKYWPELDEDQIGEMAKLVGMAA